MTNEVIPVIIPSYEPDEKLIKLLSELKAAEVSPVIVYDDGSDESLYGGYFKKAEIEFDAVILRHAVNLGKGRALKDAFNYCLNEYRDLIGVVTADSDGQHSVEDIKKCMKALKDNPKALIMGVRDFDKSGIPARSVFGNKVTSKVMSILAGVSVRDTQTGLRAISKSFMEKLLSCNGERFEFETNMLLMTKDEEIKIVEVPIKTIYIEENKTSHFRPIQDSAMIYAVFLKFLFSSLSSSVVDMVMFAIFCGIFRGIAGIPFGYIMVATVCARIISAIYNFLINYKVVFKGKGSKLHAALRYVILAVIIMLLSGTLVSFFHSMVPNSPELYVKIPVDCILFLMSFVVQREIVYK